MSESTRVFALRHGQTAWNADKRIQGHKDIALDATGRWQAAQLAAALAGELLAVIYSSDLQRALATAEPLARATGAPLLTDSALRERSFGSFEGQTFDEIQQRWPLETRHWLSREPDFEPGGGESLTAFSARCVGAAARLAAQHPGAAIALVAHGGVLDCLYRAAVGVSLAEPRGWQLGNATINRLLFTGERFSLVGWNDAAHLEAQAAP
ncbi:MAG: histidine phosphatase family protein [Rubrivivax sp.]